MAQPSLNRSRAALLYVSALAMFLELLLIRYMAVEIMFFTFFKNFVLMAAFLGLALGVGLRNRAPWLANAFVVIAGATALLVLLARQTGINDAFIPTGDNAFLWYHASTETDWLRLAGVFAQCLGVTALVALVFVPPGQRLGGLLDRVPARDSYAWDLLGSILGVLGYTVTAFAGWSPASGLALVLVGGIPLATGAVARAISAVVAVGVGAALLTVNTAPAWPHADLGPANIAPQYWWSPYHRVHWEPYPPVDTPDGPVTPGYLGFLNGHYYFDMLDFRLAQLPNHVMLDRTRSLPGLFPATMQLAYLHYLAPYAFQPAPHHVLLLGAGPGNDAAVALASGAQDVTAVEIDPEVVRLGRELHPLRPYSDPRVHVVVNDARAFMAQTTGTYDMVSFGHLDSINLVNSFSSIRTDSFIYTTQSAERAFALVKPGGILSVSFAGESWILERINALLKRASGKTPLALLDRYLRTTTFIVRKDGGAVTPQMDEATFAAVLASSTAVQPLNNIADTPEHLVPTDDWPFLLLNQRQVSPYHMVALLLLLLLAALATRGVYFQQGAGGLRWCPFWLGVGFMLIETKSITEFGLLYGTTWVVTAVAIVGVLAMNLLALAFTVRVAIKARWLYAWLFSAIVFNLLLPVDALLSLPLVVRLAAGSVLVFLPLFFAGALFTQEFTAAASPARVFGSNVLGAMVGGTLEYLSVLVGFRALWGLAAAVYLLALLSALRQTTQNAHVTSVMPAQSSGAP